MKIVRHKWYLSSLGFPYKSKVPNYKNKQAKVAAVLRSMNLGVNFRVYAPYYYDGPLSFHVGIKTRTSKSLPALPSRIGIHDITYFYKREGECGWSKVP